MPLSFNLLKSLSASSHVHCFSSADFLSPHTNQSSAFVAGLGHSAPVVQVVTKPPTPLHAACERGDVKTALAVLSQKDLNAQDSEGETPVMKAAKAGSVRTVELLIKAGANFEIADTHGWTVLHWTVQSGHADLVATILDYAPVLLNVRDKRGLTPLHVAAWTGSAVLIKRLLAEGADLHATTQWGETPLHMAAYFGHFEASDALLTAGADPAREDRMKRTPAGLARGVQDERVTKLFAQKFSS
jgi:ankyrin repeat protein